MGWLIDLLLCRLINGSGSIDRLVDWLIAGVNKKIKKNIWLYLKTIQFLKFNSWILQRHFTIVHRKLNCKLQPNIQRMANYLSSLWHVLRKQHTEMASVVGTYPHVQWPAALFHLLFLSAAFSITKLQIHNRNIVINRIQDLAKKWWNLQKHSHLLHHN